MQFCSGRPLDELQPELTRQALLEVAAQTGRMVRNLHAIDPESLAAIDKGESWDALVSRRRREVLPELVDRGLIVPAVVPELEKLLDEALAASRTAPAVVVHGDLNAEHLLLDERGGKRTISGLIDFGDARIGVPDYEWMPLWLGLCKRDAGMMRAILQVYDPALLKDGRVGRRIAAWTLLHDFGTDAIAELFDNTGANPSRAVIAGSSVPGVAGDLVGLTRPQRLCPQRPFDSVGILGGNLQQGASRCGRIGRMSERLTLHNPRRPNVVWVFGDQHRADATSYRGDGNVFHGPTSTTWRVRGCASTARWRGRRGARRSAAPC